MQVQSLPHCGPLPTNTLAIRWDRRAPYIAGLKPGELVDVLPLSSVTNVTGTIYDSTGATFYSAASLFAGQTYTSTGFTSAVINEGDDTDVAIAFGLDTSLTVTKGWDNVTGWGTPNVNTFLKRNQVERSNAQKKTAGEVASRFSWII